MTESKTPERRLVDRLCRFFAPLIAVALVGVVLLLRTGEVIPAKIVAWFGSFDHPFLYLNEFSDHSYRYKLESVRRRRPEVLVIGNSRMNQWRSSMFRPFTFYNASNCLYTQADYRRFLEDLGPYTPKVILFSLDFFTFNPGFDAVFQNVSYDDLGFSYSERLSVGRALLKKAVQSPASFLPNQRDPLYHLPALGLHAARTGTGFRIDGSYQYGAIMLGSPEAGTVSVSAAVSRVDNGAPPFLPASRLDEERRVELERFAALARQRGIKLVAITMPYEPRVTSALNSSSRHGIWRQFYSEATVNWIRSQGILYFDFTRLESFGGKDDEFFDPFHPTETAVLRMLLRILDDPNGSAIFRGLSAKDLLRALSQSTKYEVYKNEF